MSAPSWEWIEKVIRIDSVTHQSNEELVRAVYPLLVEAGLKVEEQKVVENGQTFKNLLGFSHPADARDLLVLNTHLDTVSCGNREDWTKTGGDPFKATRVRDRIYGLGTADVKLDFLCKIWAAQAAKPWKVPFVLVGTYGEERGLVGAQTLLASGRIKPKYALVGEPSNLELIYAHKGHIVFTLSLPFKASKIPNPIQKQWKGKAAHSSTPALGENAIRKAINDVRKRGMGIYSLQGGTDSNRIPDLCEGLVQDQTNAETERLFTLLSKLDELEREFKKRKDARFNPSSGTLSLNMARMGDEKLNLTFDIRCLPDMDANRLAKEVEVIAQSVGSKVAALAIDYPLKGKKDSPLMKAASKALKECGVRPACKTKASSTEAALYHQYGAEAVVFGPGISVGNVHRPNEHNSLRQIGVATRFYTQVLAQPIGGK